MGKTGKELPELIFITPRLMLTVPGTLIHIVSAKSKEGLMDRTVWICKCGAVLREVGRILINESALNNAVMDGAHFCRGCGEGPQVFKEALAEYRLQLNQNAQEQLERATKPRLEYETRAEIAKAQIHQILKDLGIESYINVLHGVQFDAGEVKINITWEDKLP